MQAPQHAGIYDLRGPSQNAWPNSFQTSYGNTISSPVIVKLVAPHASLTGQTGAVLAIFAVAALRAYVLAAAWRDVLLLRVRAEHHRVPRTIPVSDLRSGRRECLDQGS